LRDGRNDTGSTLLQNPHFNIVGFGEYDLAAAVDPSDLTIHVDQAEMKASRAVQDDSIHTIPSGKKSYGCIIKNKEFT